MDDYEVIDLAPQPTAVLRGRLPVTELPGFFERAFHATWEAIEAQGAAVAGPPFGYYPTMPGETVEVEAGFPVTVPIEPSGEVVPSELPGGQVVKALHIGPYETLEATYERLQQAMGRDGLTGHGGVWEVYLTDPADEPDPARWQTLIFWPLA